MTSPMRFAALATSVVLAVAGISLAGPALAEKTNWNGNVTVSANGSYRLGNPSAPVQITEYVSYTCPHCAAFHKESDAVLRLTVIPKGQVAVTVTNFLRNPVDMTVAMLTACGDPKTFFVRHNAFMATQDTWLKKAETMNREQQQRWYVGDMPTRMRAVASDFGFYAKVQSFGITRAKADACLANQAQLDKLRAQMAEVQSLGLTGTPSFAMGGKVLGDVHTWSTLSAAITEALSQHTAGQV